MKELLSSVLLVAFLNIFSTHAQTDTLTASPNPFPSSTNITVRHLDQDTITLKVYNRWGEKIETLFQDLILSGTITVTFNADTLPNGAYYGFLSLNSDQHNILLFKDTSSTNIAPTTHSKESIQVFPNPTSDQLKISSPSPISSLELYDKKGSQLLDKKHVKANEINLSSFDQGIYILHVKTDNRTFLKKIVKE